MIEAAVGLEAVGDEGLKVIRESGIRVKREEDETWEHLECETLIIYAGELVIAAVLLWYDQRLFFFWFFLSFLIGIEYEIS